MKKQKVITYPWWLMKLYWVFKKNSYLFRILISALFLLSAFAKMYPSPEIGVIKFFENKQLIDGLGFNAIFSQYLSRSLIAFEIFIAISILQANYLKRIILPISILLLLIFSSHLTYSIFLGDDGNCGCFGELLPMTPIQALIKNIVTIAILGFLYKATEKNLNSSFKSVIIILLSSMLFMFIYVPLKSKTSNSEQVLYDQKVSTYSKYVEGIDEGEKLLCFFVPGCEHCQIAAKQITDLSKEVQNFPDVVIVFMDEETDKIPDFFEIAGSNYDYQIMDIYTFMEAFWYDDNDTPGVVYLNNGNVLEFYQGSEESGSEIIFNPEELKKTLENR